MKYYARIDGNYEEITENEFFNDRIRDFTYAKRISITDICGVAYYKDGSEIGRQVYNDLEYNIHVINRKANEVVSELKTKNINLATQFIHDAMSHVFYEENGYSVCLYDSSYGYYAIAKLTKDNVFELITLRETIDKYYALPYAIDMMENLLEG